MYRNPNSKATPDNLHKKRDNKSPAKNFPSKNNPTSKNTNAAKPKTKPSTSNTKENNTAADFINNSIHDYLLYKELHNTMETFRNELARNSPSRRTNDPNSELQLLE